MSDFGTLITFGKDSANLGPDKRAAILAAVNQAVKDGEFSSHIQDKNYTELHEWEDNTLCLKFTEYYEDEDADEIREFAEEEDIDEANELIEAIKPELDPDLEMAAIFTDW